MNTHSKIDWEVLHALLARIMPVICGALLALPTSVASAQPVQIALTKLKCLEETNDGPGDDEIYVMAFVADLAPAIPRTMTFKTKVLENVDDGFRNHRMQIWSLGGSAAAIGSPNDVLILVGLMEHDSGRTSTVKAAVQAGLFATLVNYLNDGLGRASVVRNLISDMNGILDGASAIGAIANLPFSNGDERIGRAQELVLTANELQTARNGGTVSKTLEYRGDGGHYRLYFEITD